MVKDDFKEVYLNTPIKVDDENNYIKLKTVSEKIIQYLKGTSLIILLCIIIIFAIFNKTKLKGNRQIEIDGFLLILLPLISILLYILFSYILHRVAFSCVRRVYITGNPELPNLFNKLKYIIPWLFTPDLMLSKHYKAKYTELIKIGESCKCESLKYKNDELSIQCYDSIRIMNKFFIKFSNWLNVIFSVTIGIVVLVIIMVDIRYKSIILFSLFCILIYRLFSRTIEIASAFYKDVVQVNGRIFYKGNNKIYLHGWMNSFLRKPARISLAVHSLFELLVNFFLLYLLTFFLFGDSFSSPSKVSEYILGDSIFEFILYTISVMFFNISYINYGFMLWNILHVWQVTLSTILIVLSIASYLGYEDDLYKRENDFFVNVLPKINESHLCSELKEIFNSFLKKWIKF